METKRLYEIAGIKESPVLITENGPVYKYDLQEIIAQEINRANQETIMKREVEKLKLAQASKSLSAAMGFTGIGFDNSHSSSTTYSGPGGVKGFLGIGFK